MRQPLTAAVLNEPVTRHLRRDFVPLVLIAGCGTRRIVHGPGCGLNGAGAARYSMRHSNAKPAKMKAPQSCSLSG